MQALRLALFSSVLFATSIAIAKPVVAVLDDEEPSERSDKVVLAPSEPEKRWFRLEGGIGVRWGSVLINNVDATGSVKQFHLDGGIRFRDHRVLLYGQYALHQMQIPIDELAAMSSGGMPLSIGNGRGLAHRLAAHGRYSFARGGGDEEGGLDLFADVGVGVQHIRWDAGGAWTRPDLQLALGVAGFGVGETKHGGLSLAIVLNLAPRNDVLGAGRACGGPCDYATEPTGFDRSFMFDVTLMFGK